LELVRDGINYIPLYKFFEICEGFDEKGALILSQYLHDIGVVLHFQDDPILCHIVIINPEWGTGAVYKAIDTPSVMRNHGKFCRNDLPMIWADDQYQGKFDVLLQLMKNFQLCYEIPSDQGRYILPQLLPYQPVDYQWDGKNNLVVEYRYSYYIKNIIIRFIVNSNEYIEDHDRTVWQNGVVLTNKEYGARAEIVVDEVNRLIRIKVSGAFKKEFLAIIMDRMLSVHEAYSPKLSYETMVPCNCSECKNNEKPYLYKLNDLHRFMEKGIETIQCYNSFELVYVAPMIEASLGKRWVYEREEINDPIPDPKQKEIPSTLPYPSDKEKKIDYINPEKEQKIIFKFVLLITGIYLAIVLVFSLVMRFLGLRFGDVLGFSIIPIVIIMVAIDKMTEKTMLEVIKLLLETLGGWFPGTTAQHKRKIDK